MKSPEPWIEYKLRKYFLFALFHSFLRVIFRCVQLNHSCNVCALRLYEIDSVDKVHCRHLFGSLSFSFLLGICFRLDQFRFQIFSLVFPVFIVHTRQLFPFVRLIIDQIVCHDDWTVFLFRWALWAIRRYRVWKWAYRENLSMLWSDVWINHWMRQYYYH